MYHAKTKYKEYYKDLIKEDIYNRLEPFIYILVFVGIIYTIIVVTGSSDYKLYLEGVI